MRQHGSGQPYGTDPGHRRHGHARAPRRPAPAGCRQSTSASSAGTRHDARGRHRVRDRRPAQGRRHRGRGDGAEVIVHSPATPRATTRRRGTWCGPRRGPGRRISCTSRSSAPTGFRWSAASTGRCSATSQSKRAAEQIVADSGLPWTTLRATQFHDLRLKVAQGMAKLPVIPVPCGFRFQPVDTGEVAARLVELALGAPAGLVPDIAGPRGTRWPTCSALPAGRRKHRLIVPVRLPGKAARAFRDGANLAPDRAVGHDVGGLPRRAGVARRVTSLARESGCSSSRNPGRITPRSPVGTDRAQIGERAASFPERMPAITARDLRALRRHPRRRRRVVRG